MAGVNGYFNGKYVSKRERHVILLFSTATILYIMGGYILFYSNLSRLVASSAVLELNKFLFISHMSSVIINALIIIEGFMARNILQIVLTTFLNLILFITTVISISLYDVFPSKYVFFSISIANILFSLYILFLAFGLRKEFGWFYYKAYGADPMTNKVHAVRKIQSVFIRLTLEIFLSFWLFNSHVLRTPGLQLANMMVYCFIILLYIIEGRYESYVLRAIHIILSLLVVVYLIANIPLFLITGQGFTHEDKTYMYHVPVVCHFSVKALIMFWYTTTLFVDAFYFNKGFQGCYTHRQRRRAVLT
ncbi:hypothetical protein NECID01_1688 [Nematocida sp. AWRm77]|nr:hypothetical protein NECID01_1688 [Nematocida sp. AWRm77]